MTAMAAAHDATDLDFTMHFGLKAITAEKLPPPPPPEKLVIDPNFRIGIGKLESDGYFVAVARPGAPAAGPFPAVCKVMVVEDEPVTNAILLKVLTADGFTAYGAIDAAALGSQLKKHGLPHIILLDVELPKVSGFQILSRIRKHPSMAAIPVLIITSRSDMVDVVRGLTLGANGYLSKPVTVESLRAVLKQILGGLPQPAAK